MNGLEAALSRLKVAARIIEESAAAAPKVSAYKKESLSQQQFIRKFGSKAQNVRRTNSPDFNGLKILGLTDGFTVDVVNGKRFVCFLYRDGTTFKYSGKTVELKRHDSLSNMWRGLLKHVR